MENKDVYMVSLDTSSTATGVAVWNRGELIKSTTIKEDDKDGDIRVDKMSKRLINLLEEYKPVIVVTENLAVSRNMNTVRLLALILGVIRGWVVINDSFYNSFKPSEWRKLIDKVPVKRAEAKQWAILKCREMGLSPEDDNEAEAILIGQAYINLCNENYEEE